MTFNAPSLKSFTSSNLSAEQTLLLTKRPAPQVLATEQRIAIAKKLLLAPFGLTESHLTKALNEIRAHKVDDADLYFQYTRSEGWGLRRYRQNRQFQHRPRCGRAGCEWREDGFCLFRRYFYGVAAGCSPYRAVYFSCSRQ